MDRRHQHPLIIGWMLLVTLSIASTPASAEDDAEPGLWNRVHGSVGPFSGDPDDEAPLFDEHACPARSHFGHFFLPTRSYSAFESPTSYGSHPQERCRPEVFSPRGIGVARRSGWERMDYSPYVLSTTESNHGPSYYKRHVLAPCCQPHCGH